MNQVIIKQQKCPFIKSRQDFQLYQFHYNYHNSILSDQLSKDQNPNIPLFFEQQSIETLIQVKNIQNDQSELANKYMCYQEQKNDDIQVYVQNETNVYNQLGLIHIENPQIYMIHHMFNNSEYSRNIFSIDISSNDFQKLHDLHNDEIQILKIEIQLNIKQFQVFQQIYTNIRDLITNNKNKNDDIIIELPINPAKNTIQVCGTLDMFLRLKAQLLNQQEQSGCIQEIIHFILTNLQKKTLIVNPQYIHIKTKSHFQIIHPELWIQNISY